MIFLQLLRLYNSGFIVPRKIDFIQYVIAISGIYDMIICNCMMKIICPDELPNGAGYFLEADDYKNYQ